MTTLPPRSTRTYTLLPYTTLFRYMIRRSMRSFLKLEQAQPNVITITEAMTFEDNAAKNQIWYRGDSYELDQLYKQLPHSNINFWGATSTPDRKSKRVNSSH